MVQIITGVKLETKDFTSLVQLVKSKKILHEGGKNSKGALQKGLPVTSLTELLHQGGMDIVGTPRDTAWIWKGHHEYG